MRLWGQPDRCVRMWVRVGECGCRHWSITYGTSPSQSCLSRCSQVSELNPLLNSSPLLSAECFGVRDIHRPDTHWNKQQQRHSSHLRSVQGNICSTNPMCLRKRNHRNSVRRASNSIIIDDKKLFSQLDVFETVLDGMSVSATGYIFLLKVFSLCPYVSTLQMIAITLAKWYRSQIFTLELTAFVYCILTSLKYYIGFKWNKIVKYIWPWLTIM